MAVTRLKRKARRNRTTARNRKASIQRLNSKPVIKNVDVEEVKASFGSAPATKKKAAPKAKKAAPKEEVVAEKETPKAKAEKAAVAEKEAPKADDAAPEENKEA